MVLPVLLRSWTGIAISCSIRVLSRIPKTRKLVLGTVQKYPGNPLFEEDKPWEQRFDNLYANVIYDVEEDIYKIWYSPFIIDDSAKGMTLEQRKEKKYRPPWTREMAIAYATSVDGITWVKPELGLVEFEGSTANNILWRGIGPPLKSESKDKDELWGGPHGNGIFKDLRERDPNRRYKGRHQVREALGRVFPPTASTGIRR